jgi:hypothetical protein
LSVENCVYDLTFRLRVLGKTHADVIRYLNAANITYRDSVLQVRVADYSRAKSGVDLTPKAMFTMDEADKIVTKWEQEAKNGTTKV